LQMLWQTKYHAWKWHLQQYSFLGRNVCGWAPMCLLSMR
jgi:hypothetical protein